MPWWPLTRPRFLFSVISWTGGVRGGEVCFTDTRSQNGIVEDCRVSPRSPQRSEVHPEIEARSPDVLPVVSLPGRSKALGLHVILTPPLPWDCSHLPEAEIWVRSKCCKYGLLLMGKCGLLPGSLGRRWGMGEGTCSIRAPRPSPGEAGRQESVESQVTTVNTTPPSSPNPTAGKHWARKKQKMAFIIVWVVS